MKSTPFQGERGRKVGEIVSAFGTCHTPYLFTRPKDENPEQLDLCVSAMQELGTILDETKPDAILFFGSDHLETFSVTCMPAFAIIAGNRAVAKFGGRTLDLPVHRDLRARRDRHSRAAFSYFTPPSGRARRA